MSIVIGDCRLGRRSGRGGEDVRWGRRGTPSEAIELGMRRSNPQSWVTSHQNEYKEFTIAANSLRVRLGYRPRSRKGAMIKLTISGIMHALHATLRALRRRL